MRPLRGVSLGATIALLLPVTAVGQSTPHISAADSAARAWPTQPAYLWGRAIAAALAGDDSATGQALAAYADLGLGRDLHDDARFTPFLRRPGFAALVARLDANRAPLRRSRVRARLTDSTVWPEGLDYDPHTGRYYLASVRHRTVIELAPGRAPREILAPGRRDVAAVLGVRVDPAGSVLWVTTSSVRQTGDVARDSAVAALLRVRISDGAIERRWDLAPSPRGHTLGDLAVGPTGDVFVTDSDDHALYRLRAGGDTLEPITNPLFHSLQGVAPDPGGSVLYVADYSHGLLHVDLATHIVTRLDDAPHSTSLGCDGIAWDRGAIVAVQNGVSPPRVMQFVLDAAGRRIVRAELLDRNLPIADEPTIGVVVGRDFVYVANSQWEKYRDDSSRVPGTRLTGPVLLAVPLPR